MLRNDQGAPYLPATQAPRGEVEAGSWSGKSRLCSSSSDLTGCLLQGPRWQQLALGSAGLAAYVRPNQGKVVSAGAQWG